MRVSFRWSNSSNQLNLALKIRFSSFLGRFPVSGRNTASATCFFFGGKTNKFTALEVFDAKLLVHSIGASPQFTKGFL